MSYEIYTPDFSNRHEISHAISIRSEEKYNGIGKISIVLPLDDYNLKAAEIDSLILDKTRKTTFVVVQKKIDTNKNQITLNGLTSNSLLNKRVAYNQKNITNVEAGVYSLVSENLRGLPAVEVAKASNLPDSTNILSECGQLLDTSISLLDSVGLGHRMVWNPAQKKHTFQIYKGKDLTSQSHIVRDEHTLLLLHGEEIKDSSIYNVPLTNQGVTANAAQNMFGGKSLYFNGNAKLLFPSKYAKFLDKDFSVDWWEYAESGAKCRFATLFKPGSGFMLGNSGSKILATSAGNGWDILNWENIMPIQTGTWIHWAFSRKGSTCYLFKNGILKGTKPFSGAIQANDSIQSVIGTNAGNSEPWKGYIDEFRISDVARWTENFTPPDKPYEVEFVESGNNIHAVSFSHERGTAKNLIISDDISALKTTFYISGKKADDTRIVESIGGEFAGGERYEQWIPAELTQKKNVADAIFISELKSRAMEEATKYTRRQNFSVDIDSAEYGTAYHLGDIVTCVSIKFGVKFKARVTAVKFSLDINGEKTSLVLGEPDLTVMEEVKLHGRH